MKNKERHLPLYNELKLIKDDAIYEWTIKVLNNAPEYFYTGLASSTGKYHPKCACGPGGIVVHTQRVVYIADRLCTGWKIEELERDIVLSACILHDLMKAPKGDAWKYHAIRVEECFPKHRNKKLPPILEDIRQCIRHHMGPWTTESIRKPLDKYTHLELATYTSDYIATTRDLVTPVDDLSIQD